MLEWSFSNKGICIFHITILWFLLIEIGLSKQEKPVIISSRDFTLFCYHKILNSIILFPDNFILEQICALCLPIIKYRKWIFFKFIADNISCLQIWKIYIIWHTNLGRILALSDPVHTLFWLVNVFVPLPHTHRCDAKLQRVHRDVQNNQFIPTQTLGDMLTNKLCWQQDRPNMNFSRMFWYCRTHCKIIENVSKIKCAFNMDISGCNLDPNDLHKNNIIYYTYT